ncbi:MAG: hypothetical protein A2Z15_01995 [Chloroflexi bacterium RBG_16_50_11]|nr:MAG: hypothetical protein A2Z15_01995 [Chloroflexi bacterium RBG_16_50_11]
MLFKGFKFGKSKDSGKGKTPAGDVKTKHIAKMEEQLKDRTDNLMQTEKKLKRLSDRVNDMAEINDAPVRPHGPVEELALEPENTDDEAEPNEKTTGAALEENIDDIKLLEIEPKSNAPPPTEKEDKNNLDTDSLKALFTHEEDEENPLINLINSLPDITVDELTEDLKEIKDIIRDWQKK